MQEQQTSKQLISQAAFKLSVSLKNNDMVGAKAAQVMLSAEIKSYKMIHPSNSLIYGMKNKNVSKNSQNGRIRKEVVRLKMVKTSFRIGSKMS